MSIETFSTDKEDDDGTSKKKPLFPLPLPRAPQHHEVVVDLHAPAASEHPTRQGTSWFERMASPVMEGQLAGGKHPENKDDEDKDDEDEDDDDTPAVVAPPHTDQAARQPEATDVVPLGQHAEQSSRESGITPTDAEQKTFEDLMESMGPEYAAATSGETLQEVSDAQQPAEEQQPQIPEASADTQQEDADDQPWQPNPAATSSAGAVPPVRPPVPPASTAHGGGAGWGHPASASGGAVPPRPPVPPTQFGAWQNPNNAPQPQWSPNTLYQTPGLNVAERDHQAELDAERRGLRLGLVAGVITGYLLRAYLDKRKQERYERTVALEAKHQAERTAYLENEQQQLQSRLSQQEQALRYAQQRPEVPVVTPTPLTAEQRQPSRPEQRPMYSQPEQPKFQQPEQKPAAISRPEQPRAEQQPVQQPEEQIFDEQGRLIHMEPGWHVERSAGGYTVVLDQHNRVVHNVIKYGEAFQSDQKREQLASNLFSSYDNAGTAATAAGSVLSNNDGSINLPQVQMMDSGQAPDTRELPAGQPEQPDVNHRLPDGQPNAFVAALTNPWLWTAIALLLIAYFVAALA